MRLETAATRRLSARHLAWVVLLILGWLLLWTPLRPLLVPDEGRYVGVAWEMLRSGNWITPTLNGFPYFHKPPLFYWITAAGLQLFGLHEWVGRLASVIGATVGITAVYAWVRQRQDVSTARLFLLLALVQPLVFGGAQYANLDMLVAGMITATLVLLAHSVFLLRNGGCYQTVLAWAYAFAGLGFLAKGLIGLVLPALALLCWLTATRQLKWLPKLLLSVRGWLVLLALVVPWLWAMQQRYPDFFHYFFVVQHFDRFAKTGFNNMHPWWFYPTLLALFLLPFAYSLWRSIRAGSLNPATPHADMRWLMWIWAAVIILFFSLPKSKLVGYILPAMLPLVYLCADALVLRYRARVAAGQSGGLRYTGTIVAVSALLCITAALLTTFNLAKVRDEQPLGHYLQQHLRSGDEVMMFGGYYFSVPFYAALPTPVQIVDNWQDPATQAKDNWKKEITDAAEFTPTLAEQYLRPSAQLLPAVCTGAPKWLIAGQGTAEQYPLLQSQAPVFEYQGQAIWYIVPGQTAACG